MSLDVTSPVGDSTFSETPIASAAHPSGRNRLTKNWLAAAFVTLLLGIGPAVIWPGASSWANDEPALFINALLSNRGHHIADRGLFGNFGVPYGPLPTHVYQLLLLFTHNLFAIVVARALLCSTMIALSLLWLSRTLRLTPWFAPAVVLGPYVWFCERALWDATFMFPIGMLALAAYAAFLRNGSRGALLTAVIAGTFLPLIHPQALPFFAALAGHALWKHRRSLRQIRGRLLLAGLIMLVLNMGYALWAVGCIAVHFSHLMTGGHFAKPPFLTSLTSPLLGGRLLAGEDFLREIHTLRGPEQLALTASFNSQIAIVLVWVGIGAALVWRVMRWQEGRVEKAADSAARPAGDRFGGKRLTPSPPYSGERAGVRGRAERTSISEKPQPPFGESRETQLSTSGPSPQPSPPSTVEREPEPSAPKSSLTPSADAQRQTASPLSVRNTLGGIALAALVLQMMLAVFMHVPAWPQYCMGNFPVIVLFAWFGVDALQRIWLGYLFLAVWGLSVGYITLASAWQLHHYGWIHGRLMVSMSNQIEVAEELNQYTDCAVWTDVPLYQDFPHAMGALRMLYPPDPSTSRRPSHYGLLIHYKASSDPLATDIELVELQSPKDKPADAQSVDISASNSWK